MTETSFNNYRSNVMWLTKELGHKIQEGLKSGNCEVDKWMYDFKILNAYIDILLCYDITATLTSYTATGITNGSPYFLISDDDKNSSRLSIGDTILESSPATYFAAATTVSDIFECDGITCALGNYRIEASTDAIATAPGGVTLYRRVTGANCLTPTEMKNISEHVNRIFGVAYCINYILDVP